MRYDWAANPTEARHGLTTVINPPYSGGFVSVPHIFVKNPSTKDFAGRIGIAWDPFRDHKTSIRAGAGNFFDIIMAREYIFGFSLAPPFGLGAKANPTYGPAFAGGGTPNLPALNSGESYQISQTPHMYQYNLTIQRDIGFGSILSVGYVGAAGIHLLNNFEQNPPTPVIRCQWCFSLCHPGGREGGWKSPTQPGGRPPADQVRRRTLQLQFAAGWPESPFPEWLAVPSLLHLFEIHGQRLE